MAMASLIVALAGLTSMMVYRGAADPGGASANIPQTNVLHSSVFERVFIVLVLWFIGFRSRKAFAAAGAI
jgi:hypothetical protein